MRDDPSEKVISYARAAEILGVCNSTIRVWVHRGRLTKPDVCSGVGFLLELPVLELERTRRVALAKPSIGSETSNVADRRCPESSSVASEWCCVPSYRGADCTNRALPDAPFPICSKHLAIAAGFARDLLAELPPPTGKPHEREVFETSVVYYVRLGDLIKIGTTRNLAARLPGIGPVTLLVTEPGSYNLERMRHNQFIAAHHKGEWFHPSEDLLSHIEMLRKHQASAAA